MSKVRTFAEKWPLYSRLLFALLVVFGLVGEMSGMGGVRALLVLVMLSMAWVLLRILKEAQDALFILHRTKVAELERKAKKE